LAHHWAISLHIKCKTIHELAIIMGKEHTPIAVIQHTHLIRLTMLQHQLRPPHHGGGSNHFSTQAQPQPNYHQQETTSTSTKQQLSQHGNHAQPEFPQRLTQGDEHQGSSNDIDNSFDDDFLHFLNFLNGA